MKIRLCMLALMFCLFSLSVAAEQYAVDPVHSTAMFRVQHLGAGYTYGVFTDISGSVHFDGEKAESNSVEITIKTDSINTFNEARDKHLRNPDFFDVETYPEMSFKSTSWKQLDDDTYEITGNFTLHGVTKKITITAEYTGTGKGRDGETRVGFESTFDIKRSDYGMDKMIPGAGDDVRITVAIEGVAGGEKQE